MLINLEVSRLKNVQLVIKRFLDLMLAVISLVIVIPVMLITIIVIKFFSPEDSAIFVQERIGYNNKPFVIYKLRTMTNEKDEEGNLLSDEIRMKKWGRLIRKLSIDELPQIWAIFTGQMSWIGPRPLLAKEMLVMTKKEQLERQSMLPGITGWEAVNENKSDSRREMAEFDLEYVRNWSLMFDFKIVLKTIAILIGANRADDSYRAPKLKEEEIIREERIDHDS